MVSHPSPAARSNLLRANAPVVAAACLTFLLTAIFLWHHLSTPADNARLQPNQSVWTPMGVIVTPLQDQADGLQANDLVIAVEGKRMEDWAQALYQLQAERLPLQFGQELTYTVLRKNQPLDVRVRLGKYDLFSALAPQWGMLALIVVTQFIAAFVLLRRPAESTARALFVFALGTWSYWTWVQGTQVIDIVNGEGYWLYRLPSNVLFLMIFAAWLHLALVFPRRHPVLTRFPRLLIGIYLLPYLLFWLYMAAMRPLSVNTLDWLGRWAAGEWLVAAIFLLPTMGLMVHRYRTEQDPVARRQWRWVILGLTCLGIGFFALWLAPGVLLGQTLVPTAAIALISLPMPITLAIAILCYHWLDIDFILNRALVYGALTASTMGLYIAIVGTLGVVFRSPDNPLAFFLATGAVAVIFQPLRERLQRAVNRLMYGERDEPYAVMTRLSQRLEATLAPAAVLPTIVETVAQALKLPYAAIEIKRGEESEIVAAYGQTTPHPTRLPLVYQGNRVGDLLVAPRSANESFSPADMNLLTTIARQAGTAVHAVQLTADLQRSREHLVTAREEERRRIRRDLHDGLGPVLAALAMQADHARELTHSNPRKTEELLADITAQAQAAVADIRRLVYDLRPPSLDELGLVGALRAHAANLQSRVDVVIDAPAALPLLSAAVEVAAFRIAQEALTNVVRHAQARRCEVRLTLDDDLRLEIGDDGIGLPAVPRAGVGLTSMRERAEEVGGMCLIETVPTRGTRVTARLPLTPVA